MDGLPCGKLRFLIAGAQKCGTTALDAYLRRHVALAMATPKETHFFDREVGIDWRAPDYDDMAAHFSDTPDRLRGEATPVTLYWTPAHRRILAYNPDMRFLVMLRAPGPRALSHWRMNRANGLESLSFSESIRGGRARLGDAPAWGQAARWFSYVERGLYGRQVAALATLFPLSNMLFITQADLLEDPDNVLARVADFLGVAPFDPVAPGIWNAAAEPEPGLMSPQDAALLDEVFRDDLERLTALTGVRFDPG